MMTQNDRAANPPETDLENVALERALEGLFRLAGNRRFDNRQTAAVGAPVTRAGYALLRTLADREVLSLREVAAASHMDAAAASRQVNQLVEDGLITRRAAQDARAVELALTPRGRRIYEGIVAYRLARLGDAIRRWSAEDRRLLTVLVERLAADLSGTGPPTAGDD